MYKSVPVHSWQQIFIFPWEPIIHEEELNCEKTSHLKYQIKHETENKVCSTWSSWYGLPCKGKTCLWLAVNISSDTDTRGEGISKMVKETEQNLPIAKPMKASDCPTFCPWSHTSKRSSELCLVMSLKIVNGIVKLSLCKNSIIKCQKHYCSHFESVLPPTNSHSPGTCLMSLAWFINLQK